jgi:sec-independent protein translocase protein TatA
LLIIAVLIILLFGARRLPDAARGLGQSLRILKKETQGLRDEDEQRNAANNTTTQQPTTAQPQFNPQQLTPPQQAPTTAEQTQVNHEQPR